jgi:hypothetical protein
MKMEPPKNRMIEHTGQRFSEMNWSKDWNMGAAGSGGEVRE